MSCMLLLGMGGRRGRDGRGARGSATYQQQRGYQDEPRGYSIKTITTGDGPETTQGKEKGFESKLCVENRICLFLEGVGGDI